MAISAAKVAPRAIAIATVGYCIWPSLTASFAEPESTPPVKVAELSTSLLSPALPPCPTRNPFARYDTAKSSSPGKSGTSAGLAAKSPGATAATIVRKQVDPLNGLRLDATCIVGDQRMAIINGHVYTAPHTLRASTPTASPLTMVDVLPYKVLFEYEGRRLELGYPNLLARAASSRDADTDSKLNKTSKSSWPFKPKKSQATLPNAKPSGNAQPNNSGK
jgi:hypothetical protein